MPGAQSINTHSPLSHTSNASLLPCTDLLVPLLHLSGNGCTHGSTGSKVVVVVGAAAVVVVAVVVAVVVVAVVVVVVGSGVVGSGVPGAGVAGAGVGSGVGAGVGAGCFHGIGAGCLFQLPGAGIIGIG